MRRCLIICALVLMAVAMACEQKDTASPDEQQLARINKELALLLERMSALEKRVTDLEAALPKPEGTVVQPTGPAAVPAETQPQPPSQTQEDSPINRTRAGDAPAGN